MFKANSTNSYDYVSGVYQHIPMSTTLLLFRVPNDRINIKHHYLDRESLLSYDPISVALYRDIK